MNNQSKCKAVLRSVDFGWSEYQGTKRPQLLAKFELSDGPDKGQRETWFASLSDDKNSKGVPFCDFTFAGLRACGWTGDDISELPYLVEQGHLSKEVTVTRETKVGKDGKERSSIKYVSGPRASDSKGDKSMSASELVALAKTLKARKTEGASDELHF